MGRLGKKLLYILGSLFILFVAVALIMPPLLISKYKDQIITLVQEQTGRNVQIDNISARLLPNAQITLKNVTVPSVTNSANEYLLTSQSFHAKVALLPLLTKTIKIDVVELKNTKVYAEILPDGSNNWTMAFMQPENINAEAENTNRKASKASHFNIKLDKARLTDSEILFLNRMPGENRGMIQQVKNVNLEASAKSITGGPFVLNGRLIWNELPLEVKVETGKLTTESPSINAFIKVENSHEVGFEGEITTKPHLKVKGDAKVISQNPANLVQIITGDNMGLPMVPVSVSVKLDATDKKGQIDNGKIAIGKSQVNFQGDWLLDDIILANIKIRGKNVNIDEILASLPEKKAQTEETNINKEKNEQKLTDQPNKIFKLPENINANFDAQIQNVIYNKEAMSNIVLQARLESGVLHVPQVSAILPGSSPIGANMVIKNSENSPYIDGNFSFKSPAVKTLIAWLGGDVTAIPKNRLNQLDFRSDIAGDLNNIRLNHLDGQVDDMNIQGSLGTSLQGRLSVFADISIDKLDINPWIAAFSSSKEDVKISYLLNSNILMGKAYANASSNPPIPLDADLKVNIGQLIYEDIMASNIQTDIALKDDNLNIHNAIIGNIAGAKITATGEIFDLSNSQKARDLTLSLNADSIAKLLQLAHIKDINAEKIGAVAIKSVINGSLKGLIDVNGTVKAIGGHYNLAGQLNRAEIQAGNMNINQLYFQVKHNNLNQVTAVFSPETKIPKAFQSVDIEGHVQINDKLYKVNKFSGKVGSSQIKSANFTANLNGDKPDIQMDLNAAMLNLDALQEKQAQQKKQQAAARKPGTAPWTDDKIDFSGLNALNLTAKVNTDKMRISGKNLTNVKLNATLKDGLLNISDLSAGAYGGKVAATAKINAKQAPKIDTSLNISSLNLNQLSKDMAGVKLPIGYLNMQTNVNMTGHTSRQLINSLGGKGNLKVAGLGAQQSGSEWDAFLSILQKIAALNKAGILDVAGDFTINKGIVNLSSMQISGPIGGNAKGNVDLPKWILDIKGAFTILDGGASKLVLAALGKQNMTESHDFRVYGSVDKPQMDLPSDLQKALNFYKAANEKDIKSLITNGVNPNILKKLGVSDKDSALINNLIGSFGGNNNKKTHTEENNANKPKNQNKNPASSVTDKAIDKVLGEDNPFNDAAKGLINEEAGKVFEKLF